MRKILLLSYLLLTACANSPTGKWKKPNSTDEEFFNVRYNCLQQSQQHYSKESFDNFGVLKGDSEEGIKTNKGLFNACMNAHGFVFIHD